MDAERPAPERLLSVNVGQVLRLSVGPQAVATGIFKSPVEGRVMLRRLGVDGDRQADLEAHGGPDKAAYLYSADDHAWWERELGRPVQPGEFGENLTVTGLTGDRVHIGDRLLVGGALVEAVSPRIPCFKLGLRMADPYFPKRFAAAGRPGFYVRVLEEGEIGAGDEIRVASRADDQPTIVDLFRLFLSKERSAEGLRRIAEAPAVGDGWQRWAREKLAALA